MDKFKNKYRIQSHRKPNWDYSGDGLYFLTINTQNRECNLGKIVNTDGRVFLQLSDFGKIVKTEWYKSFEIRNELILHEFIMMPNHLHTIVEIRRHHTITDDMNTDTRVVETHGRASLPNENDLPINSNSSNENDSSTITDSPNKSNSSNENDLPINSNSSNENDSSTITDSSNKSNSSIENDSSTESNSSIENDSPIKSNSSSENDSSTITDSSNKSNSSNENDSSTITDSSNKSNSSNENDSSTITVSPNNSNSPNESISPTESNKSNHSELLSIKRNPPIRLPKSISSFIAGFKSAVNTKIDDYIDEQKLAIPKYNRDNHFFQPNYHDHIIRNNFEYQNISNYIKNNPVNWNNDTLNV